MPARHLSTRSFTLSSGFHHQRRVAHLNGRAAVEHEDVRLRCVRVIVAMHALLDLARIVRPRESLGGVDVHVHERIFA